MSQIPRSEQFRHLFAPASILTMGLAATLLLAIGCSRTELDGIGKDSIAPDSREITADSYKRGKVKIMVPPGNRSGITWETLYVNLPPSTKKDDRWEKHANDPVELRKAVEKSYNYTLNSFKKDPKTLIMLKEAAILHGLEPSTLLGVMMGEHTFNVGVVDNIQKYAILKKGWGAEWAKTFTTLPFGLGTPLTEILKKPAFDRCRTGNEGKTEASKWDCYGSVWGSKFAGKPDPDSILPFNWPKGGLRSTFFNPIKSGYTYGMGQLDPIRALMVTDRVNALTGLPMVSIENPQALYEAIIDPTSGIHYVAATIRLQMERIYEGAHFDISQNAGISATVYNKGGEKRIASERFKNSLESLSRSTQIDLPVENYYGWLVNEKMPEIKALMDSVKVPVPVARR